MPVSLMRQTLAGLRMLLVMTVLVGVLFPAAVWGLGRVGLSDQADGSLVRRDGAVVGSSLIGQDWKGPQWFHGRPSASDYAGDTSGGTNLGADDPALRQEVTDRRTTVGPGVTAPDALTASGSGLDPHITPAYAQQQVRRVAAARHLDPDVVEKVVREHTQGRTLGYLGMPRVNVLEVNLALAGLAGD
ncbi:potassium-transporting ATPase subunit KdpC [Luteipulveratus halotolerans]|uniref:Potassium-transporting ATPase KdpC subunit n=1 Tax=Luteipulveratus halotolerans TaxID=1631356 RepID=A0A0L6CND0_9MICO|nr:potassium-transporting ATPase subunit KdpC [Luteipulveratus halotolerans]KNX39232.1 potassium transporter KtrA [Luteipulveratus halotolerans]